METGENRQDCGEPPRRCRKKLKRFVAAAAGIVVLVFVCLFVFFDEAVLLRRGTVFRVPSGQKLIAITFDDGPSPVWTPRILAALKEADIKATFFMLGAHAELYPDIAKSVAEDGHEIGNHSYDHHVLLSYSDEALTNEIMRADKAIAEATGRPTKLFRPPKAWLTQHEKAVVNGLGYTVVLWSLNSKDWVTFDDEYLVPYLDKQARSGDIVLFHDSGGVFTAEGGDRHETVKTIPQVVKRLRARGYRFVTVGELLESSRQPLPR